MGGFGSGTWDRWDKKDTIESQNAVDIRQLKRKNMLHPGCMGTLQWSAGDISTGSIWFKVESERIVLQYRYRSNSDEWENVEESVQFDRTTCTYGGDRRWFLCPSVGCGRRVAVLYGAGRYFACRHCYDLVYESQRESAFQRASRRHHKIITRLGGDIDDSYYPEKPKGMHTRTYRRLVEEAEFFNAKSELGLVALLEHLGV